jgi:O-antigen ligase
VKKFFVHYGGFIVLAAALGLGIGWSPTAGLVLAGLVLLSTIGLLWPQGLLYASISTMIVGQLVRLPIFGEDSALLLNDLVIPMLAVVWVVRGLLKKTIQLPRMSLWLPLGGLVLTMLIAGLINYSSYDQREWVSGMFYLIRWVEYALLLFIIFDLSRTTRQQQRILSWTIASAVIVAGLGFIQLKVFPDFTSMVPQGWDPHIGRLLSTWFDPNFLGGWLAMFAGISLALALVRPTKNLGWWTIFLIIAIAEVLTFSRSGYLGFLTAVVVVTSVRSRALLFLGAIVAFSTVLLVPRVQERVLGIRSVDQTAQFRIVSWNNALDIVSDHPWFGVGYNHYKYVQEQRGFVDTISEHSASGSDSSLLTILVTTGVVGVFCYLWLYGAYQKRQSRRQNVALVELVGADGADLRLLNA